MEYAALNSHKRYSFASIQDLDGKIRLEARAEHHPGEIRELLCQRETGSPVAVETIGNWYWIISEIEGAGMISKPVHARQAKMMLASVNKTDRLDARGTNLLQRCGTLPTVQWSFSARSAISSVFRVPPTLPLMQEPLLVCMQAAGRFALDNFNRM